MKLNRQYILCLDVGFRNTGWELWSVTGHRFVRAGLISTEQGKATSKTLDDLFCCSKLAGELGTIIGDLPISRIVGEFPTGGSRQARSTRCMSLASGVVVAVAQLRGIPFSIVTPNDIKRIVNPETSKPVEKAEVIAYAKARFGTALIPKAAGKAEHVADAMTVIDAYLYGSK